MKTREDLTEAELACLRFYEGDIGVNKIQAYSLGKKIAESLKSKQWEPKGGHWFVDSNAEVIYATSLTEAKSIGIESETEQGAQRIADLRIEREILNARIVEENERTGFVADCDDTNQGKHHFLYNSITNMWITVSVKHLMVSGIEYCSKESAKIILKELNNNRIAGIER